MYELFVEPLSYRFMQYAMVTLIAASIICASVGVHLVVRRMSFFSVGVSHAVLPGVVVAFAAGINVVIGSLLAALAATFGISWLTRKRVLNEDAAIGAIYTGMFALGIVMLATLATFQDMFALIFGDILAVNRGELQLLLGLAVLVVILLLTFNRELELTALDPAYASSIGLSPDLARTGLLVLVAFAVVAGITAVGIVLTASLLISSASAASMLSANIWHRYFISVSIAIVAGILALYVSYHADLPSGGSIVIFQALAVGLAWCLRWFRNRMGSHTEPVDAEPAS